MLTDRDIDDLRPRIAAEPEGSPARLLLAEIDRRTLSARDRDRAMARQICLDRGHTPAEADKLVASWETGQSVEMVTVECNYPGCFFGEVSSPGCMGSQYNMCPRCHGTSRCEMFKVPD